MAADRETSMDKLERVARPLCAADGKDPAELHITHEIETVPWAGGGTMQRNKRMPLGTK